MLKQHIKIIFLSCFLLLFVLLGPVGCDSNKNQSSVQTVNGITFNLSDYKGKWVIINYWASWCKKCFEEIPELNAFYNAHKNDDIIVFGVNYDQIQGDSLKKLAERMGIQFPILTSDPAIMLGISHVPEIPTTYLITPEGKVKTQLIGLHSKRALENLISSQQNVTSQRSVA